MTSRQATTEATRMKLIETADRLIKLHGYENVSVEDITDASGVAKGTFYRHFKRKEDIILALSQTHLSSVTAQIDHVTDTSPKVGIRNYLVSFMEVVKRSDVELTRQWIRYIVLAPDSDHKWSNDYQPFAKMLEKLVKAGMLSVETPVADLAQLLFTQVYGVVLTWCLAPEEIDPVDQMKRFCDIQLASLLSQYYV
ncbi:MAG TPA: hypothetical protein DCW31_07770 [Lactobacillus sp.]|nr:hypothetical protein [Lactobacillus sp.]